MVSFLHLITDFAGARQKQHMVPFLLYLIMIPPLAQTKFSYIISSGSDKGPASLYI